MMVMVTMMGMLSAFSLDDMCQWNGYACTMNITARQLARAPMPLYYGALALMMLVFLCRCLRAGDAAVFGRAAAQSCSLAGFGGGVSVMLYLFADGGCGYPAVLQTGRGKGAPAHDAYLRHPLHRHLPHHFVLGPVAGRVLITTPCPGCWLPPPCWRWWPLCVYISYRVSVNILENKEF